MDSIGFDLHKTHSQICVLTSGAAWIERRIRTTRESLSKFFSDRPTSRILLESSTESEWVARFLEELGHEVVVGDPNFAPMYSRRYRRIKTDRRDARALAEACRVGAYRPAHRVSDASYRIRVQLRARRSLVHCPGKLINQIRSLLRHEGIHLPAGQPMRFLIRLSILDIPTWLVVEMQPVLGQIALLNEKIAEADARLGELAKKHEVMRRLMTVPGVGPVTAATFVSTIDDITRFDSAQEVRAYLGLVPRELSSGERQRRGVVTKAGNRWARTALVEAAWSTRRSRHGVALRVWTDRVAQRRGRRKAIVALARKVAGILYAIWRDEAVFSLETSAGQSAAA